MLQSSYTSRRLVDRIRITVLEYRLGPLPSQDDRIYHRVAILVRRLVDRIYITVRQIQIRRRGRYSYLAISQGPSIIRGHLLRQQVYLHTISTAVQLCLDGDPKVIQLLSEGFLAGVKGGHTRPSSQYSSQPRTTTPKRVHQLKAWEVKQPLKRCSYPGGYPIAI